MTDEPGAGPVPPYVSWATVNNKIAQMEQTGVPARIDGSYLVGMAGGTQNQFKQALRSLGLIDESDRVTATLVELVNKPDDRPGLIGQLLQVRYPSLARLGADATHGQLDELLGGYGLGKETRRKAATFYLAAANYAGLPLSPHLKAARASGGRRTATGGARRSPQRRTAPPGEPAKAVAGGAPSGIGAATHSIDLRSGGTVTVTVSMNIFQMSRADRDFVLGLVDALQDYASRADIPSVPPSGSDED